MGLTGRYRQVVIHTGCTAVDIRETCQFSISHISFTIMTSSEFIPLVRRTDANTDDEASRDGDHNARPQ
jgi:hypothetical protein